MRRPWMHFGVTLALAVLMAAFSLGPAFAQGAYPGGYMSAGNGMPYQYPPAPSYGGSYGMGHAPFVRYTVQPGDSLARIATRFHVSVLAILRANPRIMNPNRVFVGQTLFIPARFPVEKHATLYTIRFGDTLSRIAARFGTSVAALLRANPGIRDPNLIIAGQTLVIPVPYPGPAYGAGTAGGYGSQAAPQPGYPTPAPTVPPMAMPPQATPAPSEAPPQAPAETPAPGAQTATVNLSAQNFAFSLATITVPAGAQVTVNFNNQDAGVPHTFSVYTDSSAQQVIFKGQTVTGPATVTYTFTAPSQPGTYFFRCDIHPAMMNGQFVVR